MIAIIVGVIIAWAMCIAVLVIVLRAKDDQVYAPVPNNNRNWLDRLTTRIQRATQLPLGYFYPLAYWQGPYRALVPEGWTAKGSWRPGRVGMGWPLCREWEYRLFLNGAFFIGFSLPFCVVVSVRWYGGDDLERKSHWDFVLGYRPTGVLGASCRIQSDSSSLAGYDAPNTGQAHGWADGLR